MSPLSTDYNVDFLAQASSPLVMLLLLLAFVDLMLKGWTMWRAARMNKKGWFIALLIINSLCVLPVIFLLVTKNEYAKLSKSQQ